MFEVKKLDPKKVLPLALAFCGFVVFTNLSLTHNTVGFYQMAKTSTTPVIVILQYFFYGKKFPWHILASLVSHDHQCRPFDEMLSFFFQFSVHAFVATDTATNASVATPQGVLCAGVILATGADTSYNTLGATYAACGVLVTSLYQIVGVGAALPMPIKYHVVEHHHLPHVPRITSRTCLACC